MGIPPLVLTQEQATSLLTHIQAYRRYALTQLAPSTERNTNQRQLQALQGKLIDEKGQQSAVYLFFTREEVSALKQMVADLLVLTAREPATDQRDATLHDLVTLKTMVEKLWVYGQGHSYTRTLR